MKAIFDLLAVLDYDLVGCGGGVSCGIAILVNGCQCIYLLMHMHVTLL